QNRAPVFCFDAFSLREPVSTSLENALPHEVVPVRAGVPLPVVAEIGSRRGIVGFVPLHAIRLGIVAGRRGLRSNHALVVISVVVVIGAAAVIAVAVIAVAGPDAGADR